MLNWTHIVWALEIITATLCTNICQQKFKHFLHFQLNESTKEWTPDVEDLLHVKWKEKSIYEIMRIRV